MIDVILIADAVVVDWAVDTIAPEDIDYSKFDILFYGASWSSSHRLSVIIVNEAFSFRHPELLIHSYLGFGVSGHSTAPRERCK